jgi:hypothetical protein
MASKRRGGFGPPELRGTLGTLLRTTTGVVRDVLERGAREGRARLDDVRANRRRQDALGELGELVLDLIRRGEIDLAELPEARDLVRQLDQFDNDPADEPEPPRATSRRRFDDRATRTAPADDGTVASGATASAAVRAARPTTPGRPKHTETATTRAPTKPIKGATGVAAGVAGVTGGARQEGDDVPTLADMPAAKRTLLPRDPRRKGGISFDDDDLNEYMHPDDVPPKGSPRDPDDGDA